MEVFSSLLQPNQKKKIMTVSGKAILFSLIPVICFYLLEFYQHNPFQEVRTEAQLFNIFLLELTAWTLFFLTGRAVVALRIELVAVMIFGLVNHYVMEFRSTPFVPWDILSVNTAASVAGNYDFMPSGRVIFVSILFLAMIFCVRFLRFQSGWKLYARMISAALVVLVLCVFVNALQNDDFKTKHYLYPFLFTPAYMTQVNGMLVTFAMNLEYIAVDRPADYHAEDAKETLETYESSDTAENTEDLPNIIVIMDEAFSDLSVVGDFETNEDYMPFVHSLEQGNDNTVTGYLNVSVCGGNTANTEFEFLTGNTMAFLPAGSIPYQQYIKSETPSLAEYLLGLGYETYGMHPYNASGWDRDRVYPLLGFENTIFFDDFTDKTFLRKYVSDDSDFKNIIQTYEQKDEGHPAFIFNVTMQNHGSYTDAYNNFTPDVTVTGADSFVLEQYLSLMKRTDQALENLIDYFAGQKEKTIIVFFGDHQPADSVAAPVLALNGKDANSLNSEDQRLRYQVPYVIWANYDIEEGTGEDTSANYLAARVLQTAGVPTSAYQNYLLDLEKDYPVISAVRVEKADGTETNSKEEKKGLLQYQQLQYYSLFDEKED